MDRSSIRNAIHKVLYDDQQDEDVKMISFILSCDPECIALINQLEQYQREIVEAENELKYITDQLQEEN